jgi:hypothetical protein
MLHHVAFIRTDVLEAHMTIIIIRVDSASGNNVKMMVAMRSSETSVFLTRATWCHIPEDGNLHNIT